MKKCNNKFIVPQGTKEIFNDQFGSREDLIDIIIPKSVEKLGAGSFYNCINLKSITFEKGSNLKFIGNYTFQNCNSLQTILFPDNLERIGSHAFWHCTSLPSVISFPNKMKCIESTAFFNTKVREVILPSTCAYQNLDHGFPYAPSFPEECNVIGGIGKDMFSNYPFPLSRIRNENVDINFKYIVPQGTKIIENNEFGGRMDLVNIIIPNSVEKIGASAFYFCSNLRNVIFEHGSNLKYIDYFTFQNCLNLRSIILPEKIQQIRAHSFWACSKLKQIIFPETIKEIDASAFFSTKLSYVDLPECCKYQQYGHGFPYEASFPDECYIDGGIPYDFYKGYSMPLQNYEIDSNKQIISSEENDNFIVPQGTIKIKSNQFAERADLKNIVIPKSVEIIGAGAFYMCSNLESVKFEKSSALKTINGYAFQNCFKLTEIEFPNELQQIAAHSFWACPNLKNIKLPQSLEIIDAASFYTTNISEVLVPLSCKYQEFCHGFPYEASFPEKCVVKGGIPCDLYNKE